MDQVVLVISCDRTLVGDLEKLMADDPLALTWVASEDAETALSDYFPVRAILVDGQLPNAIQLVRVIKTIDSDVPVIWMALTYSGDEEIQVRRMGAFYCIIEDQAYDNLHRFLMRVSA